MYAVSVYIPVHTRCLCIYLYVRGVCVYTCMYAVSVYTLHDLFPFFSFNKHFTPNQQLCFLILILSFLFLFFLFLFFLHW